MTRVMIDVTHSGFPTALPHITALAAGNLVAVYDTGSATIAATPADIAAIPTRLHTVMIDQGFTGSPNLHANVRDVERGAWTMPRAVDKTGWNVERPTLYIGSPDTVQEASDNGWKGDVWLVRPSNTPPTVPPAVPPGMNVVAVQWNFGNPNFDESVVFDSAWPAKPNTTVIPTIPPGQWKNPGQWTWKAVAEVGVGLNGELYAWVYNPVNGSWTGPVHIPS